MDKMIEAAYHRGPDNNGKYIDDYITLGHNLLSIVDTETNGKQPWLFEDTVLVYNGEIYNYKELRDELDYNFQTDTDTEVLSVGLKLQGKDFISKCDGMFAFAWYNKNSKELIMARDSNGTKPIYYGNISGKFCFSSEIKSLLAIDFKERFVKRHLNIITNKVQLNYLTLFQNKKVCE